MYQSDEVYIQDQTVDVYIQRWQKMYPKNKVLRQYLNPAHT